MRAMIAVAGALAVLIVAFYIWMFRANTDVIQSFKTRDVTLDISARGHERGIALCFSLSRNGKQVALDRFFGTGYRRTSDKVFDCHVFDDCDVLVVFQRDKPMLFHLMFDLGNGDLWPFDDEKRGLAFREEVGSRILRKITETQKNTQYRFDFFTGGVNF